MKKIKLLIASLAAISFCSCSDFLDSTPKGTMTEDKFFLSPDAGYSTVVKCYDMLGDAIGYEIPRMMLYNIATDDSEKGGSDASDRPSAADLSFGRPLASNADLAALWEGMYKAIARCNLCLENIPNKPLVDADGYPIAADVKARYIGEVKFLRAFYYFELCKIFGGVPLVERSLTVNDSKSLQRATEAETAEFIMNDLADAALEENLPSRVSLPESEIGRVTKEAVWAMQARVYMYFAKDDASYYEDARDAAKKVVESGCELAPNFQSLFLEGNYLLSESILPNIQGDDPTNNVYGSFVPVYSNPRGSVGAYGFDQPTQNLVDEFEEGDPRLLFTIVQPGDKFPGTVKDEVLDFSTYPNTGYHSRKAFLVASRRGLGFGDDAWTFNIIRYADVLLIYAEALIQTNGDKQTIVKCINAVRQRANDSRGEDAEAVSRVLTIPDKDLKMVTVNDDLLEAVKHERRVELAMEYNRLYDLKRWNCYIETMNAFANYPYAKGRGAAFKKGVNELFPIPQSEIDRSGGSIKQNPGY